MSQHKSRNAMTRREALSRIGSGFGMMAFASLVGQSLTYAQGVVAPDGTGGVATLDYPQRVKRVIFLFMNGGCSTIDCFDPKPALEKYDGQPMPGGSIRTERRTGELMKSPFKFKKYGECGMDISELWRHLLGSLGLHGYPEPRTRLSHGEHRRKSGRTSFDGGVDDLWSGH